MPPANLSVPEKNQWSREVTQPVSATGTQASSSSVLTPSFSSSFSPGPFQFQAQPAEGCEQGVSGLKERQDPHYSQSPYPTRALGVNLENQSHVVCRQESPGPDFSSPQLLSYIGLPWEFRRVGFPNLWVGSGQVSV